MSTGPGELAAAESIGTSPRAFGEDSDKMGRMSEYAQVTVRKKGNWPGGNAAAAGGRADRS
jgi:hypothetical protein